MVIKWYINILHSSSYIKRFFHRFITNCIRFRKVPKKTSTCSADLVDPASVSNQASLIYIGAEIIQKAV